MSAKDIGEAIAYSRIEPWGESRADLRAGIIASVIANVNRDSKTKPFQASDFMPDFTKSEETESEKLSKEILEALNIGNNR